MTNTSVIEPEQTNRQQKARHENECSNRDMRAGHISGLSQQHRQDPQRYLNADQTDQRYGWQSQRLVPQAQNAIRQYQCDSSDQHGADPMGKVQPDLAQRNRVEV